MSLEVLKEQADTIAAQLQDFRIMSELQARVSWLDEGESPAQLKLNFLHDEVDKIIKLWHNNIMDRILEEERFMRMKKE